MTVVTQELVLRSAMYDFLSLAFLYPEEGRTVELVGKAERLLPAVEEAGWKEVAAALKEVDERLRRLNDEALLEEFIAVFGHTVPRDCPPYEAEYGQAHVFQKSQTLADLQAFLRAFGVELSSDFRDRPDHLSVEMEFMSLLTLKEAHAASEGHGEDKVRLCREAQEAFLARHLTTWIREFVHQVVRKRRGEGVFEALGRLVGLFMDREFDVFQLRATSDLGSGPVQEERPEDFYTCPLSSAAVGDAGGLP